MKEQVIGDAINIWYIMSNKCIIIDVLAYYWQAKFFLQQLDSFIMYVFAAGMCCAI